MQRPDPNLPQLQTIAAALGDLREQVVFVGGSTAGLLLTDPLADAVRPTFDVDAIVDVGSLAQFHRVEARLRARGFVHDAESGVICRWRHQPSGVVFDLMPVDATVLGFSNRWYPEAVATAERRLMTCGLEIRVVTASAFVATKLEAFLSRGRGDFMSSHDLEDVLNVVDGRPELPEELSSANPAMRHAIAETFATLLRNPNFINCLPGLIPEADRTSVVAERLRAMAIRT